MFITGFAAVALKARSIPNIDAKVLSKPFHLRTLSPSCIGCWTDSLLVRFRRIVLDPSGRTPSETLILWSAPNTMIGNQAFGADH